MGDTPINVAYPSAEDPCLRIALGACRFDADLVTVRCGSQLEEACGFKPRRVPFSLAKK
jgi:hypothetical protein